MKRYVKCSVDTKLLTSNDGYFELVRISSVGVNNTPFTRLYVNSSGLAEDYVIEIRLDPKYHEFNGEEFEYLYNDVSVAHGMSMKHETLENTAEYISVLQSALDFAYEIKDYLANNGLLA